ncbi:hypothetical protein [Deinococcus sonorensis]|uniref:Uncharacterized protein n=2 Tax=Deinococcus sonorensis TaxID=309891 RepID=A0AAU7UCM0_9DEIO
MTPDPPRPSGMHDGANGTVHAQLDEFRRLILQYRRDLAEVDVLIRQSAGLLATSEVCLKRSHAVISAAGGDATVARRG